MAGNLQKTKGLITKHFAIIKMICGMLRTLYCIIFKNSEAHLKNSAVLYKIFKECLTIMDNYAIKF